MAERVEIELDPHTAAWLRRRCAQRGGSLAAAEQLRADAWASSVDGLSAWYSARPGFVEDSEREIEEALTALR